MVDFGCCLHSLDQRLTRVEGARYEQSLTALQMWGEQELRRKIEGLIVETQRLQRVVSQFETMKVPRPHQQLEGERWGGHEGEYGEGGQYQTPTEGTRQGENSPWRKTEVYRYEGVEGPTITPKGPRAREGGEPPDRGTHPSRQETSTPEDKAPNREGRGGPEMDNLAEFTGEDPSVDIGRWLDDFEHRLAWYGITKGRWAYLMIKLGKGPRAVLSRSNHATKTRRTWRGACQLLKEEYGCVLLRANQIEWQRGGVGSNPVQMAKGTPKEEPTRSASRAENRTCFRTTRTLYGPLGRTSNEIDPSEDHLLSGGNSVELNRNKVEIPRPDIPIRDPNYPMAAHHPCARGGVKLKGMNDVGWPHGIPHAQCEYSFRGSLAEARIDRAQGRCLGKAKGARNTPGHGLIGPAGPGGL